MNCLCGYEALYREAMDLLKEALSIIENLQMEAVQRGVTEDK